MVPIEVKDDKLQAIVDKIGFDPRDFNPQLSDTEDDRVVSPFRVLTGEELDYLIKSRFLCTKKPN